MAVRYVGGKPTRITCYTERKNTDRWMYESKQKLHLPRVEIIGFTAIVVTVTPVLIWFVAMCFR